MTLSSLQDPKNFDTLAAVIFRAVISYHSVMRPGERELRDDERDAIEAGLVIADAWSEQGMKVEEIAARLRDQFSQGEIVSFALNVAAGRTFQGVRTIKEDGLTTVEYRHLQGKDSKRNGVKRYGTVDVNHHADVLAGHSIELFGQTLNRNAETNEFEPATYALTYKVGDVAEFDSYNLHYFGKILKITAKTVTLEGHYASKSVRLSIAQFSRKNRRPVAEKTAYNSSISHTL